MKTNIKFCLKILLVLVLSLCILFPINLIYKVGDTYKGTHAGMEKFEDVPNDIEFANFGPSYGMNCFDYTALEAEGKTCFNFALTMQDVYHDYSVYKAYEDNFKEGAIVAIPVSYFTFCSNTEAPSSARYYQILDKDSIIGYSLENHVSAKFMPVYGKGNALIRDLTSDIINRIMSIVVKNDNATSSQNDEVKESRAVNNNDIATALKDDSAVRVLTIESGYLKAFQNYIGRNEEILTNWINEMKAKGLKPVLVLTPYWGDYANGFDSELLDISFTQPVSRIVEETGVPYVNFNTEEYNEYTTNPEYFNNCDHVSKEGGVAFMEYFVDYVRETNLYN